MRTTTETRNLPVKLSEDELAERAQQLAVSVTNEETKREEFAAWESTMKEAAKAKKAGIYLSHAETLRLGEIVETGIEDQDVACTWLYTKEAAYLRRDDTGELVQVRDLRVDEKQAVIGEEAVAQEPTFDDLERWSGAEITAEGKPADVDGGKMEVSGEIRFPSGVVVDLADREAAMREMEKFIRETVR